MLCHLPLLPLFGLGELLVLELPWAIASYTAISVLTAVIWPKTSQPMAAPVAIGLEALEEGPCTVLTWEALRTQVACRHRRRRTESAGSPLARGAPGRVVAIQGTTLLIEPGAQSGGRP